MRIRYSEHAGGYETDDGIVFKTYAKPSNDDWKGRKISPRVWPEYMRIPRDGRPEDEQTSLIVAGFFAFAFLTLIGIVAVVQR